jgi:hypothetical protein
MKSGSLSQLRCKLWKINVKLRELESLLSPFLLLSLMTNTMIIMAGICIFATATKVFDSFLMTYFFQSIKKYFGRVESKNQFLK